MNPALNKSSALQRFEGSNAIEVCNGIMFDFYRTTHVLFQSSFGLLYITWVMPCSSMFSIASEWVTADTVCSF